MSPDAPQTAKQKGGGRGDQAKIERVERASPNKWNKVSSRAAEIAVNEGKHTTQIDETHERRAKRELLGLQTLPDPDMPLATKPRK